MKWHWLSAIVLASLMGGSAIAQQPIVLSGVKVVQADGKAIEGATVLIQDGKIAKVGTAVTAPTGATMIDGKGLVVYPALIDAYCLAGVAGPPTTTPAATVTPGGNLQRQPGQGQGQGQGRRGGNNPPPPTGPLPFRKATEGFDAKSSALVALRNNGYGAALFVPRGTLTPGEGSIHPLVPGDKLAPAIMDHAALPVNTLSRGFNTYPSTLMGALSFVRQSLWDGLDYKNHAPATADERLAALGEAATGKSALLYSVTNVNDIKRAIRVGKEFGQKIVLVGAPTGIETVAPLIVEANAAVFLTGDWASAPALRKAGVQVALVSNRYAMSASEADSLRTNALSLAEKGLSQADLLAMLTSAPATILGVGTKLGDVKEGLLANLVIADGDLFKNETKIKFLLVNGAKVDPATVTADVEPRPVKVAADGVPFRNVNFDDTDGHGEDRDQ